MRYLYRNTLLVRLPFGWRAEEGADSLACFHPKGAGAVTISLHSAETGGKELGPYLELVAKRYCDHENVRLTRVLYYLPYSHGRTAASGAGVTKDGWNSVFWFVSDGRTIAAYTYLCRERTREWYKAGWIARRLMFVEPATNA